MAWRLRLSPIFSRENLIRFQPNPRDHELKPPPLTTDPVAGEEEATCEMMEFSVLDPIYKYYPIHIERAKMAIQAFQRTPPNARRATLTVALHMSRSDQCEHYNVNFSDAGGTKILNLFVKDNGDFGASKNWHVYASPEGD